MGGAIAIGRAGRFVKAPTMGGDITVDEIDGWIDATTMGGDIEVKMVGDPDSGDRHVELSSMGGDIELTVPAGLSMDFDIELTYTRRASDRYRILSDFTVDVEEDADWDNDNGEARRTIYGTGSVNGGRNRVKIRTINGNITIKQDR
jgi:DUF4097 and DUF4098 domain-containing protein YvlB